MWLNSFFEKLTECFAPFRTKNSSLFIIAGDLSLISLKRKRRKYQFEARFRIVHNTVLIKIMKYLSQSRWVMTTFTNHARHGKNNHYKLKTFIFYFFTHKTTSDNCKSMSTPGFFSFFFFGITVRAQLTVIRHINACLRELFLSFSLCFSPTTISWVIIHVVTDDKKF